MSAGEAGTLVQRQNKHLSCTYLTPTPTLKGTNNTHHLFSIALVTWGCSHSSSLWKDFGELRFKNEKGNNSPLLISCVSERYETGLKPHFSITDPPTILLLNRISEEDLRRPVFPMTHTTHIQSHLIYPPCRRFLIVRAWEKQGRKSEITHTSR